MMLVFGVYVLSETHSTAFWSVHLFYCTAVSGSARWWSAASLHGIVLTPSEVQLQPGWGVATSLGASALLSLRLSAVDVEFVSGHSPWICASFLGLSTEAALCSHAAHAWSQPHCEMLGGGGCLILSLIIRTLRLSNCCILLTIQY